MRFAHNFLALGAAAAFASCSSEPQDNVSSFLGPAASPTAADQAAAASFPAPTAPPTTPTPAAQEPGAAAPTPAPEGGMQTAMVPPAQPGAVEPAEPTADPGAAAPTEAGGAIGVNPAVDPPGAPAVDPPGAPAVDPPSMTEPGMSPPAAPVDPVPPAPMPQPNMDPFPRGLNAPQDGEMVVLYDGNGFGNWEGVVQDDVTWQENNADGYMQVGSNGKRTNHIVTVREHWHEDVFLHLEFWSPDRPANQTGQSRGNSGVYLQGSFELQVLDSFGQRPTTTNCGAIYDVAAPLVNACKPAQEWNTYEINYTAPRYNGDRKRDNDRISNAQFTVWLNGELIHDKQEVDADGTAAPLENIAAGPAPLMLQDHSNDVRYRNVWWIHLNQ